MGKLYHSTIGAAGGADNVHDFEERERPLKAITTHFTFADSLSMISDDNKSNNTSMFSMDERDLEDSQTK